MQGELLAELATAAAHIAAWSNRRGKRSAVDYQVSVFGAGSQADLEVEAALGMPLKVGHEYTGAAICAV